jgi:hypothetical protein
MSNTQRTAGHNWERKVMNYLKPIFPDICTSRYGSRKHDDAGIDLMNTDNYAFQCKAVKNLGKPDKIFSHMLTDDIKVIAWKDKRVSGNVKDGNEYALLRMKDFLSFIK